MNLEHFLAAHPSNHFHQMQDQLMRHVYRRSEQAFAAGDARRDALKTPGAVKKYQAAMRRAFIKALGGLPPSDTPLKAKVTGTVQEADLRIEKVIFQSRPGVYVTANLYVPANASAEAPGPAVLFACGHHIQGKHQPEYQTVCRYLAAAGLIVLAQDPIGQGERLSYYEGDLDRMTIPPCTRDHDYAGTQCRPLGDAIARYFVHDLMRGVDYLQSRPDVDPKRIGMTGNSGGGTQTSLMMICDPRLAAAAPATFIMDRQSYLYTGQAQDAEQIWPGMTAWGFDHEDILLGMAPKPVLVLAVKYDFFPIEGTRRTVRRARRIWKRFEKGSDLKLFEDRSIHRYTRPLARAAGRFFAKVLDGRTNVRFTDDAIQPIEPSDLWCTASGQVRGDFPRSRAVFHENRDRLKAAEKTRPPKRKQQAAARRWVKKQVCTGRQRSEPNLRVYNTADLDGLYGEMGLYFSQPGMCNFAVALQRPLGEPSRGVTVALWEKGTAGIETHMDWISAECGTGRCVLVVDVTGLGAAEPYALNHIPTHAVYGSMHKLCDDLSWLDDSLAAIRVWDLLALPKVIDDWPGLDGGDIRLYTEGPFNVYAELAALLEPALSAITTHQPMETFASWVTERYYNLRHKPEVILPGLLQLADLDDLRRWRG